MARPRITIPAKVTAGDVIIIKTLLGHKMESGLRQDSEGTVIPRKIINKFTCEFNGDMVFGCDIDPALAANPYFEFKAKVNEAGTFKFVWVDDDGELTEAERQIELVE